VRIAQLLPEQRPVREDVTLWKTSITPQEIDLYRNTDFVELLSTERINQLLERPKAFGAQNLLRIKHARFTQPIMNVILLLLAIPCVLTREPGKLKQGATICLLLTGLAMGSIFLSQQLAGNPPTPQLAAQWRSATRRAFSWALGAGYFVEEFYRSKGDDRPCGIYLLSKWPEDFAEGGG
jgi:hypothetical protein